MFEHLPNDSLDMILQPQTTWSKTTGSWQTESSIQQSQVPEQATTAGCGVSRSLERFGTVRLTEQNLADLNADHQLNLPHRAPIIDSQFRSEPTPGATCYQIKRKPLPDAGREALQKAKDEALRRAGGIMPPPPVVSDSLGPGLVHTITHFEDFVPAHQVSTWQQLDNEEWQLRRARSASAMASDGTEKLKYRVKKVMKRLSL